ncbi:phosphotransferase enzyme family protein [Paraphaeosphaeria sporulosa]
MSSIYAHQVPKNANYDVQSSSFFRHYNQLPSPDEVRSQARAQYLAGTNWGDKRRGVSTSYNARPSPAVFEPMGLFVKWGSEMRIAEGQSLYAIRQYLKNAVPVPEIYGWRTDGDEVFLYLEAISGRSLEQSWQEMEEKDRSRICRELRAILDAVRQLKQDPTDKFIGSIARDPLYDRAISIQYISEAGPFTSVKEFHDWFTSLYKRPTPDPQCVPDPFRQELPDDSEIVFTHGDLHPSNVIVSSSHPSRVVAIIDWEQAGWLPAYWEVRKAHYTCDYFGEWSEKYLPMILDQHKNTWDPWDYYTMSMGC